MEGRAVLSLILYMIAGAFIVLFASQNLDVVTVFLVLGPPLQVPLIVVIGMSFMIGFVTAIMVVLRKAVKKQTRKTGHEIVGR
ncbi:MAG: DUF1049 domain-containing protein [Alphaproteobacteria bacterium]|nr:DUF1049 domain-containing protein [Alphaproteobacteria bacterium]MBF0250893.1 DUF1049 domain-containing protein [Alphaproteobacteria bacterium]